MKRRKARAASTAELGVLRARLAEAEELVAAIRNGTVDAVVVTGERGEQVYTLNGADRTYRQLIEKMTEGALTLSLGGVILYCNTRVAEALGRPLEHVVGTALEEHLIAADRQAFAALLVRACTRPSRGEIRLQTAEHGALPAFLSLSRLQGEAEMLFCLVATDMTATRRLEQVIAEERLARLILEQAAEGIVVCDAQGYVTRASLVAMGWCRRSPLCRPFAEAFALHDGAGNPFDPTPVLQGTAVRNQEVVLRGQDQELNMILSAAPLVPDAPAGCVITLTDITERTRAAAGRELGTSRPGP